MGSTDFFQHSCKHYLRQRDAQAALPPPDPDNPDDTAPEQVADRLQQRLRAQRYLRHLCVHLDSASADVQCWPLQAVADGLCRVLSQHDEACVLVLGQRDDLPRCACHAQRVMFLAHHDYSQAALTSVVARSAAIVGADCAMLEVAEQHGVPGVALFASAGDAARRGQNQGRHWSPFDSIVLDQHGIDVAQRVARALQRGLFA